MVENKSIEHIPCTTVKDVQQQFFEACMLFLSAGQKIAYDSGKKQRRHPGWMFQPGVGKKAAP